jgi:hypothetical protein
VICPTNISFGHRRLFRETAANQCLREKHFGFSDELARFRLLNRFAASAVDVLFRSAHHCHCALQRCRSLSADLMRSDRITCAGQERVSTSRRQVEATAMFRSASKCRRWIGTNSCGRTSFCLRLLVLRLPPNPGATIGLVWNQRGAQVQVTKRGFVEKCGFVIVSIALKY